MSEITIDTIGGNCPVQAEGDIDGWPFYFRARFQHWSLRVAEPGFDPCGEEVWEHVEEYGEDEYAAGWMEEDEARAFIRQAAEAFLAWRKENPSVDGTGRQTALLLRDALRKAWKRVSEEQRERMAAEREIVRLRRALGLNDSAYAVARAQVDHEDRRTAEAEMRKREGEDG